MRNTAKFLSVIVVFAALFSTACERAPDVAAPDDVQFASRTYKKVTTVTAEPGSASKVIGAGGDTLLITNNLGLHGIDVPAGAISRSAIVTIQFQGDEGLDVTLTAVDARNSNDVGTKGFKKPVLLCLNYTQTGIDPTRLLIAQDLQGGRYAPVTTRIYSAQGYICGELDHFSEYTMVEY